MECERAREAMSAQIDGEDAGLPGGALAEHLAGCAECTAWQQRAHAVTRRARLGRAFLDRDLTPLVLAAVPAAPARRPARPGRRVALVVIALAQLAITVPLLVMGHDHDAGAHAAHELGSFDLALAIAFCVGAVRPALSAGLAWPCGIAAGGLVGTALIDVLGGQAIGLDEAQHLVALAGALLLFWQARAGSRGTAVPPATALPPLDGDRDAGQDSPGALARPVRLPSVPRSPGGAGAARTSGPAIAAAASHSPGEQRNAVA
jgi:predicted anti-sigma-YlaC factor YlaD